MSMEISISHLSLIYRRLANCIDKKIRQHRFPRKKCEALP